MRLAGIALCAVLLAGAASEADAQQSLAPTVARVSPSVVKVTAYRANAPAPNIEGFDEFFGDSADGGDETEETGTAFVVDAAQGLLVTTDYMLTNGDRFDVELASGETRPATVAGIDEISGVGLLKIAPGGLTAVSWSAAEPAIGDQAMLTAYAFGHGPLSTTGIVSGREQVAEWKIADTMFVDMAVHKGAAGGLITTLDGKAIGMATAQFGTGVNAYANLGVAIPASEIRPVIAELAAKGKVARSAIGISVTREAFRAGAMIAEVFAGTPAERAGLKADDEIISVNGEATRDDAAVRRVIAKAPIGSTLKLQVRRGGEISDVTLVTEERRD